MTDIFDGDPCITIDADGADFTFIGGQPIMDQGFENHVNISMLTEPNWWGNDLEPVAARQLNSDFLPTSRRPINRQMLIDLARSAERSVAGDEFKTVVSEATNPRSQNINVKTLYTSPGGTLKELILTRSGQNWINQARGKRTTETGQGIKDIIVTKLVPVTTIAGDEITTIAGDTIQARVPV